MRQTNQIRLSWTIGKWNTSTMIAQDGHGDEVIMAALDRHDQRRLHNVRAVSALVDPAVLSLQLLSQWAETRNQSMCSRFGCRIDCRGYDF
jgi:hypothetical protein